MIEFLTKESLRQAKQNIDISEQYRAIAKASTEQIEGATFLSHSSSDEEFLPVIINLLESHGGRVYVDKKDPELPPYTSRQTAQVLRNRIKQSKRFILFATDNSKNSRWVPWELGISDGLKGGGATAILPAADNWWDQGWADWEYLGIYDRIVWGDLNGYSKKVLMVLNQATNTATELSKWLRG